MKTSKFILQESIKTKTRFVSPLSTVELKNLNSAQNSILQFRYFSRRLKEIDLNYDSLLTTIEKYENLSRTEGLSTNEIDLVDIDINRLVINFSSSLKFFADYLDKHFLKNGALSKEYSHFKKQVSLLYDRYFSYRLFYNLRNYTQHREFPIYYVKEERDYSKGVRELKIGFSKSSLLKDNIIKKKMESDLKFYNEFFPIKPLLFEILNPVKQLEMKIFQIYEKQIHQITDIIIAYKVHATTLESIIEYGTAEIERGSVKVTSKIIEIQLAETIRKKLISFKRSNFN